MGAIGRIIPKSQQKLIHLWHQKKQNFYKLKKHMPWAWVAKFSPPKHLNFETIKEVKIEIFTKKKKKTPLYHHQQPREQSWVPTVT